MKGKITDFISKSNERFGIWETDNIIQVRIGDDDMAKLRHINAMNFNQGVDIEFNPKEETYYVKPPIRSKDYWSKWFEEIRKCCCDNEVEIEVIFNKPATILYKDGKKYVCKCDKEDKFSEELGLALCLLKSFGVSYSDFEKLLKSAKRQGGKND